MSDMVRDSLGLLPQPTAARLRALTPARVGLGRTGASQRTRDVLAFQLSHARARDAVHARMETGAVASAIEQVIKEFQPIEVIRLHSAAADRASYLQRPDLGRKLDPPSRAVLATINAASSDLEIVIADGLSALAVERHAAALLRALLHPLAGLTLAPVCIVEQGRVAIGDEIGELLAAQLSLILIGERPGLSSPDSLGAYLTWEPRVGRSDAERNCISNIRTEGLSYPDAAMQIASCITAARRYQLTGVALGLASGQLTGGVSGVSEP